MGCRQCLPFSVVQLKGKHWRKTHCRNGVVDTFDPSLPRGEETMNKKCSCNDELNLVPFKWKARDFSIHPHISKREDYCKVTNRIKSCLVVPPLHKTMGFCSKFAISKTIFVIVATICD